MPETADKFSAGLRKGKAARPTPEKAIIITVSCREAATTVMA
jgi:hypothetical protein